MNGPVRLRTEINDVHVVARRKIDVGKNAEDANDGGLFSLSALAVADIC